MQMGCDAARRIVDKKNSTTTKKFGNNIEITISVIYNHSR